MGSAGETPPETQCGECPTSLPIPISSGGLPITTLCPLRCSMSALGDQEQAPCPSAAAPVLQTRVRGELCFPQEFLHFSYSCPVLLQLVWSQRSVWALPPGKEVQRELSQYPTLSAASWLSQLLFTTKVWSVEGLHNDIYTCSTLWEFHKSK